MADRRKPSPGAIRPEGRKPSLKLAAKRALAEAKTDSKADKDGKSEGSAFRVAVRCRPLLAKERTKQPESVVQLSKGMVTILADDGDQADGNTPRASPRRERMSDRPNKSFAFDHVYDERSSQSTVYDEFVAPFCGKYLEGYNVTVFAYGQTGTGKTYTVLGETGEQRGVVPRFVEEVFDYVLSQREQAAQQAAELVSKEFNDEDSAAAPPVVASSRVERVTVSVFEVYEGKVFDLLNPDKSSAAQQREQNTPRGQAVVQHGQPLQLEMEPAAKGIDARCYWVKGGGGERNVESATDAMALLRDSQRLRHTASHALNEASSRSHCIFSLQVYRRRYVAKLTQTDEVGAWRYGKFTAKGLVTKTRANLVDLAGSEDARDTLADGATLREASDINKSLFTLRKAIEHLATKKHNKSVFQEETLTKMLASSLLGQVWSQPLQAFRPSASWACPPSPTPRHPPALALTSRLDC